MGVRADFYVGRGKDAEWLGSIAWKGSPTSMREQGWASILDAACEADYRDAVNKLIETREDAAAPVQGWPWPWDDSSVTDYAYAWDEGVWFVHYGHSWRDAHGPECQAPWDDCTHYAWVHFPEAEGTQYGTRVWLGREAPRLHHACALVVDGRRYELTGGGSRGSRRDPGDFRAEPAYWWMSVRRHPAGPAEKEGFDMICVARITKKGHRLLRNVRLVFPPTAVAPEAITAPGLLIAPKKRRARTVAFPDMKAQRNFTTGPRSGLLVVGADGQILKGD